MNGKILIVDDLQVNTLLIADVLRVNGYETVEAFSGKKAIELLESHNFDLILLDIMMPGIDGIETCRIIKENPKNSDLPIIFLSALSDTDVVVKGFKVGGHDYISKPFEDEVLLVRIKTHIELKQKKKQLEKAHLELQNISITKSNFLKLLSQSLKKPISEILKINYLLKELVDSKELVGYINKLNLSVKQLEKFSTTALLLNDLKLNNNELTRNQFSLKSVLENALLQQSAALNLKSIKVDFKNYGTDFLVSAENELLLLAFVKLIEAILLNYNTNSSIAIKTQVNDNPYQLIFEIEGEYEELHLERMDFNQNLPLLLAKLILELHSFEITINKPSLKSEYIIISFDSSIKT